MAERIATKLAILQAALHGNHGAMANLLRTMTYSEARRYLAELCELEIRISAHFAGHDDETQSEYDSADAKLRQDAEDVARLIREINGNG